MQDVKNKLSNNNDLFELYSKYYDEIQDLISFNTQVNQKIQKDINKIIKEQNKILNIDEKFDNVKDIINFYNVIYDYYSTIRNIQENINIYHLQPINIRTDKSQSFMLQLQDKLNKINIRYSRFSKQWELIHVMLMNTLTEKIINMCVNDHNKILPIIKEIREEFYKNDSLIFIYSNIVQNLLNISVSNSNNNITDNILKIIEEDKTYYLVDSQKKTQKNSKTNSKTNSKNIHIINPPLRRFGLTPSTLLMNKNKLLEIILDKKTNGNINLKKYSKDEKVGFIIFTRVVYHPIEYNINKLINKSEAQNYIQPNEYGINKKIIERFKIIKQFDTEEKWNFQFELIGEYDKVDKYYILETLDTKLYRALTKKYNSDKYSIPKEQIKDLIEYFSNNNQPNRISSYHQLTQKKALNYMFLEKSIDIDNIIDKSQYVNTQIIQNDVYMKILDVLKKYIHVKYHNGDLIKNNNDMNDILHNKDLLITYTEVMIENYDKGMSGTLARNYNAGAFPFEELLASYLKELNFISQRFMKELHDGYNRDPISDEIFKGPNKDKRRIIMDKLEEIIKSAILITVDNTSNIYSTIITKYNLLNYV